MSERYSVSVALAILNRVPMDASLFAGGLLLVTKRESGMLGLPAGHLEKEQPFDGALRELREETLLTEKDVILVNRPLAYTVITPEKVSLGLLYSGTTRKCISRTGYEMNDTEIASVRPYLVDDLLQLIKTPDIFYKPAFNIAFISAIILRYIVTTFSFESNSRQRQIALDWGISEKHYELFKDSF